jgi:hypothetical protein
MFELQMRSMQTQPSEAIASAAIYPVAGDGMSALGKMNSNLMLASGFQPYLQHRCLCIALQHSHVRDRGLAGTRILRGVDTERGVLRQ